IQVLSEKVKDGRVVSLIHRFLRAGVVVNGMYQKTEEGCPQGGVCREPHKPPYAEQVIMPRTTATSAERASVPRHNTVRQN
ncbi:MAG: hypothetical protein RBS44_14565, partial [Sphaerochaeta sp.]|nr:hypothetical protein [Sphaerochaeta sp.]